MRFETCLFQLLSGSILIVVNVLQGGNPLVRVGSFLAGLLGREEGPVDAATVGGAREAQEATAMQRAVAMWRKEVLSNWESVRTKKKLEQLVFKGVPAPVRGEVWVKMLGNRLNLTPQAFGRPQNVFVCFLFENCRNVCAPRQRRRQHGDAQVDLGGSSAYVSEAATVSRALSLA